MSSAPLVWRCAGFLPAFHFASLIFLSFIGKSSFFHHELWLSAKCNQVSESFSVWLPSPVHLQYLVLCCCCKDVTWWDCTTDTYAWQASSSISVSRSQPPRSAHPMVRFSCMDCEPMVIDKLPFDKYELEPSPLTQFILERKSPHMCWQVGFKLGHCCFAFLWKPEILRLITFWQ